MTCRDCLYGKDCQFDTNIILAYAYHPKCGPLILGDRCHIRSGSIIYRDVRAGNDFKTGHNVVIREHNIFGNHVVVGTGTVIEGYCRFGDFIKIESNCIISTHTIIGSRVFIGPGSIFTNDKYPLKGREDYKPQGPIIEDGVTIGTGVILLPGIRIGFGSFIAAGSVVTKDVPPMSLVKGTPARIFPLPEKLKELNKALNWPF